MIFYFLFLVFFLISRYSDLIYTGESAYVNGQFTWTQRHDPEHFSRTELTQASR
jgi:hypothetical protein